MEFKALVAVYTKYNESHGQQEEETYKAFVNLASQFAREHIPHFPVYAKAFKGSVPKLLQAAVRYVEEDIMQHTTFLSGMRSDLSPMLSS